MRNGKIMIIGSGPAGLMAAHACGQMGYRKITIVSNTKEPSRVHGASYLHRQVPGLAMDAPVEIKYIRRGTVEQYAKKIYGEGFDPKLTSWSRFGNLETGYSLRTVYASMFAAHSYRIAVDWASEGFIKDAAKEYDWVINSAPLAGLFYMRPGLHFESSSIYVQAGPRFSSGPHDMIDDNTIIYDGRPVRPYYRWSKLFGVETIEYSLAPVGVSIQVKKPTAILGDLPPWPDNVFNVGRFGKWDKTQLADDAYFDTMNVLMP